MSRPIFTTWDIDLRQWAAWHDGDYPETRGGWGATVPEALADLARMDAERADAEAPDKHAGETERKEDGEPDEQIWTGPFSSYTTSHE